MKLHHVQVSCPPGGEPAARVFYADGLGMVEVDKPPAMAGRGGAWFRSYDGDVVTAEVHVSVEQDFSPALKAHPALLLDSIDELETTASRLNGLGFDVDWSERTTFAGYERFHTRDGSRNRVEVMVRLNNAVTGASGR
jgi:catechol 2,3-dioxygenase-like lactoylglutathione lyase family enzyme